MSLFLTAPNQKLTRCVAPAHEQASSPYYENSGSEDLKKPFPFSILHRDPSALNIGMVPQQNSEFEPDKLRTQGEYRGLLLDWGFSGITYSSELAHDHTQPSMDTTDDEDGEASTSDSAEMATEVDPDSDGEQDPNSSHMGFPDVEKCDSGMVTATPEVIDDFERLVRLVRNLVSQEEPRIQITVCSFKIAMRLYLSGFRVPVHSCRSNYLLRHSFSPRGSILGQRIMRMSSMQPGTTSKPSTWS